MKKNKILCVGLLAALVLVGCDKEQNKAEDMYTLPDGGEVVDLSKSEQVTPVITNLKKAAGATVAALDSVGFTWELENLEAHYAFENKLTESTGSYSNKVNVDADKVAFKFTAEAGGVIAGKKSEDLQARVALENVTAKGSYFSYAAEYDKDGKVGDVDSDFNYKFDISDVNAYAYLKNNTAYADGSSEGLANAVQSVMQELMGKKTTLEAGYGKTFIQSLLGQNCKGSLDVSSYLEGLDFPLIPEDALDVLETLDDATLTTYVNAFAAIASPILTVKTYENGEIGLEINVTKTKIITAYTQFVVMTQQTTADKVDVSFFESISKADVDLLFVFGPTGALRRAALQADVGYGFAEGGKDDTSSYTTTTTISGKIKTYFKTFYGQTIQFPEDLASYSPIVLD